MSSKDTDPQESIEEVLRTSTTHPILVDWVLHKIGNGDGSLGIENQAPFDRILISAAAEDIPKILIEAAACGIPSVASNIYGLNEVIINKKTGLLHEVKNVSELSKLLILMAKDNKLRKTLGKAAFQRAHKLFSSERVLKEQINFVKMIFKLDDDFKKYILNNGFFENVRDYESIEDQVSKIIFLATQ